MGFRCPTFPSQVAILQWHDAISSVATSASLDISALKGADFECNYTRPAHGSGPGLRPAATSASRSR